MYTLNCKGRLLVVDKPLVMGILNCTPDSFYAGSRVMPVAELVDRAGGMYAAGATIIDLGGQSTRPGSVRISAEEEMERVLPAVAAIHQAFPENIISIDSFYADVVRAAVQAGASIVNDISAGSIDPPMLPTVAELNVPYVLMHMRGTPQDMQEYTQYTDLVPEILNFFLEKTATLQGMGIRDIIIDPGFGFAKTREQNFKLLQSFEAFSILKAPLLLGISRKSFIWKTLETDAAHALNGTTALHMAGLLSGASILRVHDVPEAIETVRLYLHLQGEKK